MNGGWRWWNEAWPSGAGANRNMSENRGGSLRSPADAGHGVAAAALR